MMSQKISSHAIQFQNKKTDAESDYIRGISSRVIVICLQCDSKILTVTNSKTIGWGAVGEAVVARRLVILS
jgi:hypothetical protein